MTPAASTLSHCNRSQLQAEVSRKKQGSSDRVDETRAAQQQVPRTIIDTEYKLDSVGGSGRHEGSDTVHAILDTEHTS